MKLYGYNKVCLNRTNKIQNVVSPKEIMQRAEENNHIYFGVQEVTAKNHTLGDILHNEEFIVISDEV